jgi:hypothetical protein
MNLHRVCWSCLSLLLFVPFEAFSIEVYKANQEAAVTRLKPSRKTSKDTKFMSCSCVKKRTLLALDAKHGFQAIAQVLPADFKSQPYGHCPERPAPKK